MQYQDRVLGFWLIVVVAAAIVAAISFAMLIGFVMGAIAPLARARS